MSLNLTVKVAGVTFEGRQALIAKLRGDEPCRIVPEPTNPYDKNALAVHVAMPDGTIAHVGYVPRDLAREVAPLLDGEAIMVRIKAITGGFETEWGDVANYGMQIRIFLQGETDNDTPECL
jgi:single-stranded-DNA-specific exonuclease